MIARDQRSYHSLEMALEIQLLLLILTLGAEEDFPEPNGDVTDSPSTELQLWEFWYGVLHAARRIPWADEGRQNKLVRALKARPDPAPPSPMTMPLNRNWILETGTAWSDLVMLGPSACETWNTGCGCGVGWTLPEQQVSANVNAFAARLTASGLAPFSLYRVRALRTAIEEEIVDPSEQNEAHRLTQLGLLLTVAAVWM
ncbi:hypothetical protein DL762_005516 [Monosporascus cannonballus]|uniref:Transcription factor domain-containing protein n=1 Tax=Monosporascus cannonballus TaxID=155416 RepID=A0ABY0H4Q6_9PEZI|nr:hypothetical protein DL762_005516 [Monosporascus cannonballus]